MLGKVGLSNGLSGSLGSGLGGAGDDFSANLLSHFPLTNDLNNSLGTNATFTRSSIATYLNASTNLVTDLSANTVGFESRGMLLESAATCDLLQNEALANAAWNSSSNIEPMTQDGTIAPDGTATAWKLEASTAVSAYIGQDYGTAASNSACVWMKKGNTTKGSIASISTPVTVTGNINVTLTDDWQEVKVNSNALSDLMVISPSHDTILGSPAAGDYVYIWLPQMQTADCPTSVIATAATAVTRTTGSLVLPAGIAPAVTNDFAIAFNVTPICTPAAYTNFLKFTNETAPRQLAWTGDDKIQGIYGGVAATSASAVFFVGQKVRVLFTGDDTNFAVYINGVQVLTDAYGATSGAFTSIDFNVGAMAFAHITNNKTYDLFFDATTAPEEYIQNV